MCQRHGIHGPGTGAADTFSVQPAIFQQGIEHAPGQGADLRPAGRGSTAAVAGAVQASMA